MTKEQEEQGFKVTDKRGFQDDAVPVANEATENTPATEPSLQTEAPRQPASEDAGPPIDFPSFVLSYYTQGAVLLGEVPNPYTNKTEEDLGAARNIIDILTMLEEKTKGNLSSEEAQLLESVLYELRMKFMAKTNRIKL